MEHGLRLVQRGDHLDMDRTDWKSFVPTLDSTLSTPHSHTPTQLAAAEYYGIIDIPSLPH